MTDIAAYKFFRQHAGWIVGRNAEGALALARAEERFADLGGEFRWEYDDVPFDQDIISEEEAAKKFDSGEWTGPFFCVAQLGDEWDSLSGIVVGERGTADPYCRVVQAELADQLLDRLDRETRERERAANQDIATKEVSVACST